MRKKIGIVTWHYYENFGSALQAYSLQTTISNLGYECEFVNYRKKQFRSSNIKGAIKYILSSLAIFLPKGKRSKYSFRFSRFEYDFLKQRRLSYNEKSVKKCNSKYDIFVCGSDQIWAPNVFNPIYFLSFVEDKKPKIAYAPSIGLNEIPNDLKDSYSNLLSRFDCLSVREQEGADILKKVFNLEAEAVLDPTFLIEKNNWNNLIIEPQIKEEYIFCYFLGENNLQLKLANKIAKDLGCKIISISNPHMDNSSIDIIDKFAGPREFLGYVKNAKMIITDSFHGMAFSINFNKDFYVFERFSNDNKISQNSRIHNILSKLNLEDRLISYNGSINKIDSIDYTDVNKLLECERTKSLEYLKNSLLKNS